MKHFGKWFASLCTLVLAVGLCAVPAPRATAFPGGGALYAAEGAGGAPGNLYILDPTTGAVISTVGNIGFSVTGLAFDPTTGILYGATTNRDATAPGSLIRIDPATGAGTLIGSLNVANQAAADITFDAAGNLYGWIEANDDDLYRINTSTGEATKVGESGLDTFGSGLAFDTTGRLLFAGLGADGDLNQVNPVTGAPTVLTTLTDLSDHSVASLDVRTDGIVFGVLKNFGDPPNDLAIINPTTGAVTRLGPVPSRVDAIAFAPISTGSSRGFVSGTGVIRLGGNRANFGFTFRSDGVTPRGTLVFNAGSLSVRSTQITGLSILGNTATITGRARVAGRGLVNFTLVVQDLGGAAARLDRFQLSLSSGETFGPATLLPGDIQVRRVPAR